MSSAGVTGPQPSAAVVWHDVECGAYAADLALWEELAESAGGPVLDLGCGTGRVALHLAARGHRVHGLDVDPEMVAAFNERSGELPAQAGVGDARNFELRAEFCLAIAPMQLLQLFAGDGERTACLSCAASHLRTGGTLAVAIVEDVLGAESEIAGDSRRGPGAMPDAREVCGWVYSSLPLETVVDGGEMVVRRLRQTVAPDGELSDEVDEVWLRGLDAAAVEAEAAAAGLRPVGRRAIGATPDHVGSTVVLLEREA
jgi:SAM-dependent methyltransferase